VTCIVGVKDKETGRVVIGGDSAGVAGWDLRVRADHKVFTHGPFVFGFMGSFRVGQLLRYVFQPPEHPEGMDDFEYMVTRFVEAVRKVLTAGGVARKDDNVETGGFFMVGYRGRLYTVESDYQVTENLDGYAAMGCADQVAMGALFAIDNQRMDAHKRVSLALYAAERFSAGVRSPFHVVTAGEE